MTELREWLKAGGADADPTARQRLLLLSCRWHPKPDRFLDLCDRLIRQEAETPWVRDWCRRTIPADAATAAGVDQRAAGLVAAAEPGEYAFREAELGEVVYRLDGVDGAMADRRPQLWLVKAAVGRCRQPADELTEPDVAAALAEQADGLVAEWRAAARPSVLVDDKHSGFVTDDLRVRRGLPVLVGLESRLSDRGLSRPRVAAALFGLSGVRDHVHAGVGADRECPRPVAVELGPAERKDLGVPFQKADETDLGRRLVKHTAAGFVFLADEYLFGSGAGFAAKRVSFARHAAGTVFVGYAPTLLDGNAEGRTVVLLRALAAHCLLLRDVTGESHPAPIPADRRFLFDWLLGRFAALTAPGALR